MRRFCSGERLPLRRQRFPRHCAQLVIGELSTCNPTWALGSTCYSHLTTADAWRKTQSWRLQVSKTLGTCNQYPLPSCGSLLGFASCGPHPPKLLELFLSVFLNAELPCRLDNHFGSCPQTPHRVFQPRAPLKYRFDSVYLLLLFIYFLSGLPLFCGADKSQGNRVQGRQTRS